MSTLYAFIQVLSKPPFLLNENCINGIKIHCFGYSF